GAALATPAVPARPGRFSTMTCWPHFLAASSAIMRAMISVTLPAPNGTTMVTRWDGKVCADPGATTPITAAAHAARPSQSMRNLVIRAPPETVFALLNEFATPRKGIKAGRPLLVYE